MPQKKVSIEEVAAKRSMSFHDGVVYRAVKMPKSFDKESRSATFVMTDESVDSYGDIVRAKGADLSRFASNPIALLNHQRDLILGTWDDVKRVSKRIEGTVTLADEGTAPHIDMTYNLMSQGILRAASIGFVPTEVEMIYDEAGDGWANGFDFKKWELTECSVVSVPANPAALAKSIKAGDRMALEFVEQVLDTYERTKAGLIVPKEDLEKIRSDGGADKTYSLHRIADNLMVGVDRLVDENGEMERVNAEEDDVEILMKSMEDEIEKELEIAPHDEPEAIQIKIDTSEAEKQVKTLSDRIDAMIAKFKEAVGLTEKAPPEPEYVEDGLEKAKALRESLVGKIAAE